jgi:hypothetical protein
MKRELAIAVRDRRQRVLSSIARLHMPYGSDDRDLLRRWV